MRLNIETVFYSEYKIKKRIKILTKYGLKFKQKKD